MNSSEFLEKFDHLTLSQKTLLKQELDKMSDDQIREFYNRIQKMRHQLRKALGLASDDPDYGF